MDSVDLSLSARFSWTICYKSLFKASSIFIKIDAIVLSLEDKTFQNSLLNVVDRIIIKIKCLIKKYIFNECKNILSLSKFKL